MKFRGLNFQKLEYKKDRQTDANERITTAAFARYNNKIAFQSKANTCVCVTLV